MENGRGEAGSEDAGSEEGGWNSSGEESGEQGREGCSEIDLEGRRRTKDVVSLCISGGRKKERKERGRKQEQTRVADRTHLVHTAPSSPLASLSILPSHNPEVTSESGSEPSSEAVTVDGCDGDEREGEESGDEGREDVFGGGDEEREKEFVLS